MSGTRSVEGAQDSTVKSVAKEIAERDRMDMSRKIAPLRESEDAVHIDSETIMKQQYNYNVR